MSKKVTGKDLEKLLEGVLSEREDPIGLDKKVAPDFIKFKQDTSLEKIKKDLEAEKDDFEFAAEPKATGYKNILAMAGNRPPADVLSVEDISYYEQNLNKIDQNVENALGNLYYRAKYIHDGKASFEDLKSDKEAELEQINQKIEDNKKQQEEKQEERDELPASSGKRTPEQTERYYKLYKDIQSLKRKLTTLEKDKAEIENKIVMYEKGPDFIEEMGIAARRVLVLYKQRLGSLEPGTSSYTSPRITTQTAEYGKYVKWQESTVNKLFAGLALEDRIKKLSKISLDFFLAAKGPVDEESREAIETLNNMDLQEFSQRILVLDILNTIVKEMDAGSGAYMFEYFLALLVLGKIQGKETTEEGKMGTTDFTYEVGDETKHGSAKYYSNPKQTSQKIGGFLDLAKKGVTEVQYVVAAKKDDVKYFGKASRGQADPNRIIALEVYTPKYTFETSGSGEGLAISSIKMGKEEVTFDTSKVYVGGALGEKKFPIYIVSARTRTFKEMMQKDIKTVLSNKKKFMGYVEQFFDSMEKADENSRIYMGDTDAKGLMDSRQVSAADATTKNIDDAKKAFDGIVSVFNQSPEEMTESQKITAKMLQKLIEENFKK